MAVSHRQQRTSCLHWVVHSSCSSTCCAEDAQSVYIEVFLCFQGMLCGVTQIWLPQLGAVSTSVYAVVYWQRR